MPSRDRSRGPWRILSLPRAYSRFQQGLARSDVRAEIATRYIRARPGDRVLDVGCGPADILEYLPEVEYVGVDRNARYLASARARFGDRQPGTRFAQMDVDALTGDSSSRFDIVLAQGLLHHLDDAQALTLLKTVCLLLKPGGRLVTVDPATVAGQRVVARLLIMSDRGRFVRTPAAYDRLASGAFSRVEQHLRHDLLRLPYTHLIMECEG